MRLSECGGADIESCVMYDSYGREVTAELYRGDEDILAEFHYDSHSHFSDPRIKRAVFSNFTWNGHTNNELVVEYIGEPPKVKHVYLKDLQENILTKSTFIYIGGRVKDIVTVEIGEDMKPDLKVGRAVTPDIIANDVYDIGLFNSYSTVNRRTIFREDMLITQFGRGRFQFGDVATCFKKAASSHVHKIFTQPYVCYVYCHVACGTNVSSFWAQ